MKYMTVEEAAKKWEISTRSVQRQFYYLGLGDWRKGRRARLIDTCRTGQDVFILGLKQFGHTKLAAKAEAQMAEEEELTRRGGESLAVENMEREDEQA